MTNNPTTCWFCADLWGDGHLCAEPIRHPATYSVALCTREDGHDGPCMACAPPIHCIATSALREAA